ncbi:MAG: hypothetical protein ABIB11_05580, partial [Candidatus Omnitrophota bacterium]
SIYVYGSAVSGDFVPGVSDINSVVVFKEMGFLELHKSLNLISKGIRKKISAPLFLTPEHIRDSADTFPIEFNEMKDSYLVLFGKDLLMELKIEPSHIRFVCEQQLKGKLIRIRQAFLEIGLRKRGMEALIKESFNSLFPVFRSMLRLKSIEPPVKKENIISSLAKTFGINGELFIALLKDKRNDEKIAGDKIERFMERYLREIQVLAEIADKL